MSNSWVYLFSQFTPEALLLEALIIFLLCGGYAAFWVLKKRRFGVADSALPSAPVKTYLNELILNAEQLRIQLFGLLAAQSQSSVSALPLGSGDLTQKLTTLEAKMADQAKAVDALNSEKSRLENALAEARSATPTGNEDVVQLQDKIQELEGKLLEYSVIEDDLANLKRLQQENTSLKAALLNAGIPLPPTTFDPGTKNPTSGPDVTSDPLQDSPLESPTVAQKASPLSENTPLESAPPEAPPLEAPLPIPESSPDSSLEELAEALAPQAEPEVPPDDSFAELTDQVNESLAATPVPDPSLTSEDKLVPEPAADLPEGEAPAASPKEDDLVAEFEKMLNG